jgi:hypothetical protein
MWTAHGFDEPTPRQEINNLRRILLRQIELFGDGRSFDELVTGPRGRNQDL